MDDDDENASNDSGLHLPADSMWAEWIPEQVITVNPPAQCQQLTRPTDYSNWEAGNVHNVCQADAAAAASYSNTECNIDMTASSTQQSTPVRYICEGNRSSDEEDEEMDLPEEEERSFYVKQISEDEYHKQTKQYTKEALAALLQSPEYQQYITRCQLCWCVWSENQCSEQCDECGGFSMVRPCPICHGKCSSQWTRDVEMSHSNHFAHWDGECLLAADEREGYLLQALMDDPAPDNSERAMVDALEDLATH